MFVVRTCGLDRNGGRSFVGRGRVRVLFGTGALLWGVGSRRGFPLHILTVVSYLCVYIGGMAAGPGDKGCWNESCSTRCCEMWINGSEMYFQTKIHTISSASITMIGSGTVNIQIQIP